MSIADRFKQGWSRIAPVAFGAFRGAGLGQDVKNWSVTNYGPNDGAYGQLGILRARARDFVRNDPLVATTADVYVDTLVGKGIVAKWQDETLQRLWEEWIAKCDTSGRMSFADAQRLVARSRFIDGEVLVHLAKHQTDLRLRVLEADYLDAAYTEINSNKRIIAGIQLGEHDQPTRYWVWEYHPADRVTANALSPKRIPVPAANLLHVFETDRPGQLRGVPVIAPVMQDLRKRHEALGATVERVNIAQNFAVFIKRPDKLKGPGSMLEDGSRAVTDGQGTPTRYIDMKPGAIQTLEEGEDITLVDPPTQDALPAILVHIERALARVAGLAYEMISGDHAGLNFNTLRGSRLLVQRHFDGQQKSLEQQLLRPIAKRWLFHQIASGRWTPPAGTDDPWIEFKPVWVPPYWPSVQPKDQAIADIEEIKAGLATRAQKQLERGHWPEGLDAQIRKEMEDDLELSSKVKYSPGMNPLIFEDEDEKEDDK